MTQHRREFLKKTAVLASSLLVINSLPVHAQSLVEKLTPDPLDNDVKPEPATSEIIDTDKIEIKLPKIAEKGSAVPITVISSLENIQSFSIFVEKNPVPLAATFRLSAELDAFISARLNVTETSDVIVLAETHSGIFRARAQVKIIIGGCGA